MVKLQVKKAVQKVTRRNKNTAKPATAQVKKEVGLTPVQKAWSDKVGRKIAFELHVLTAHDGRKQTQLINPETGGLVVAVNATGKEAESILVENAGVTFIDQGFDILDIQGPNSGNQVDKSDLSVPTPADLPGAAVEAKKDKDADKLAEDKE